MCVCVREHRQAERVEYLNRAHINACADNTADVQRQEIEIVVSMKCVAIVFDVAFDLKVLACFKQRPRWSREAHAPHIKIRKPRAALIKDVVDPRQQAFA